MKRYGKGLMPGPVYVATLKDGTTARMSFYSEEGKPIDFDRGRRLVAACYGRPREELGYITSTGKRRVSDLVPQWYRHTCMNGKWNSETRKYDLCQHVWESEIFEPEECPACGVRLYTIKTERLDQNGIITNVLTFPPAEITDGYAEIPGRGRVRDPYFSGEAPEPARKGKSGVSLIQHVLRQLDKDDSREARRAAELLRREFWPELEGAAA